MLMAKLFQELLLHHKFDFTVKFLVMDPGYSPANRQVIEENARRLQIPIKIYESDIFDSVYTIENHRAISVHVCGGDIYTALQRKWAVIRLHSAIISTMS